jgi:hypothetical protein
MSRQLFYGVEVRFFPKHGERVYVMRRPIHWFVFCLSLAFLIANLPSGNGEFAPPRESAPVTGQYSFSQVTVDEPAPTQFGYVQADGSFLPLAQQSVPPDVDASTAPAQF